MTVHLHWFLPTSGDGRTVVERFHANRSLGPSAARQPDIDYLAQMAGTYQRISGGRLLLNVVTGGDAVEQRRFGDWHDHDARYARTDEFLSIVRGVWSGEPFDFAGEHLSVAGATAIAPPDPFPDIYF